MLIKIQSPQDTNLNDTAFDTILNHKLDHLDGAMLSQSVDPVHSLYKTVNYGKRCSTA